MVMTLIGKVKLPVLVFNGRTNMPTMEPQSYRRYRFPAVIGLSVPYRRREAVRPTTIMPQTEDAIWYQLYFQEPGVAEAEYDRNVRTVFRIGRIFVSGDTPPRGLSGTAPSA